MAKTLEQLAAEAKRRPVVALLQLWEYFDGSWLLRPERAATHAMPPLVRNLLGVGLEDWSKADDEKRRAWQREAWAIVRSFEAVMARVRVFLKSTGGSLRLSGAGVWTCGRCWRGERKKVSAHPIS